MKSFAKVALALVGFGFGLVVLAKGHLFGLSFTQNLALGLCALAVAVLL